MCFCQPDGYVRCDFQSAGICGWTQQDNDDFDWSRTSGPSDGDLSTGPLRDHTSGTSTGKDKRSYSMAENIPENFASIIYLHNP